MGRIGDIADLVTGLALLGGGYLIYKAVKGLGEGPVFAWPELPAFEWPEPVDVTLTAGEDIPLITFESVIPEGWVPLAALEAESETVQQLADLLGAAYAMDPAITIAEITESELLAFEALEAGVTDF